MRFAVRTAGCASLALMTVLIDEARWWWRDRKWCHLVSDESLDELRAFAGAAAGLPRRGFQGDHYDVPDEYYAELIAAGAVEVESRELVPPPPRRRTPPDAGAAAGAGSSPMVHPDRRPRRFAEEDRTRAVDVVADDEPLDQLDTGGRRQVAHLEPTVAVAGEHALAGSDGRQHRARRDDPCFAPAVARHSATSMASSGRVVPLTTVTHTPRRSWSSRRAIVSATGGRSIARAMTGGAGIGAVDWIDPRARRAVS